MPIFLAIDAGGTKTQCLLADSDRVLARVTAGTVKLMRVSDAEATRRLNAMLDEVASSTGVSLQQVESTCFGLAGLSSSAVRAWATSVLSSKVSGSLELCGDEEIALDAAFCGGPGILVVSGTGSNAIGRGLDGIMHRAGGWGPILGDEGSGYWIGLEAIRSTLRARDRLGIGDAPSTQFLRNIERHWNLASTGDLIALANLRVPSTNSAPPDFATLAPIAARCAAQGNSVAASVLERAGEELAELVTIVCKSMTSTTQGVSFVPDIAFTGGILTHIPTVRAAMAERLALTLPTARILDSPVDSLEGALWRARNA
jgi:glucosamine kinase